LFTDVIDFAAARAAGFDLSGPDQLEIIEGIGAKIADLLRSNGVKTFAQLADMDRAAIQAILNAGGPNFKLAEPETWAEQADLAARNRWRELKALQDRLTIGIRPKK
jgi:predicted flap endonuclease-1-like 5' DNA nuclease